MFVCNVNFIFTNVSLFTSFFLLFSLKCYLMLRSILYFMMFCTRVFKLSHIFRAYLLYRMRLEKYHRIISKQWANNNDMNGNKWFYGGAQCRRAVDVYANKHTHTRTYIEFERQQFVFSVNSMSNKCFVDTMHSFFFSPSRSSTDTVNAHIACRYDKGEWSKCVNGSMSRKDNVRAGSDASCKPTREITKNCNKDKKQKKQDKSKYKK